MSAILMCDCTALSAAPGECPRKALKKHKFALNWGVSGPFLTEEELILFVSVEIHTLLHLG